MAKAYFLYLFSLIVLASSAFLPFQDIPIPHRRLARSPHCWSCQQEYESSGYGRYHYHPQFHSQQWSGLSHSPDGSQQQVFSGAAASANEGSQSSSEAFSLASAGGEAQIKSSDNQKQTAIKNENKKYKTQPNNVQESQSKSNIDSDYQQQQQFQDDLTNDRDSSKQLQQQSLSNEGSNILSAHKDVQQQYQQLGSSSNNGQYEDHHVVKAQRDEILNSEEKGQYAVLKQNTGRGDIGDNAENSNGRQYNSYGQQQLQYGQSSGTSGNNGAYNPENYNNKKYKTQQNNVQESNSKANVGFEYQHQLQNGLSNERDSSKQLQQQSSSNEGSNIQSARTDTQHTGIGDIEDNAENSKQKSGRKYNGYSQQQLQYGQSFGTSGNSGAFNSENHKTSEMQYNQGTLGNSAKYNENYGNSGLSQSRSDSAKLINNDQQLLYDSRYLGNEQDRYNKGRNLQYETEKFDNNVDSEKKKHYRGNNQQQSQYGEYESSSFANEKNTNSKLNGEENANSNDQKELSSKDSSYHDTQSSLNGALSLASQGVQASQRLPESGCTNCEGKGSIAYSNARSHNGSAVALSIGG